MRRLLYLTAFLGTTGVIAGAFGAHALKNTLIARDSVSAWNTAVLYHLIHVPALLAASLYGSVGKPAATPGLSGACACWAAGILLFSGSLYWLALGGPRWLGPVTPLGGVFLILGWLCIAGAPSKLPKTPAPDQ